MMLYRSGPAVLLGILFLSACQSEQAANAENEEEEAPPIPVETSVPLRGDVYAMYTGTAPIEAFAEANVIAKVAGEVREILVEEGDDVRKGQVLARLDGERLRLELNESEAKLRKLQRDYERIYFQTNLSLLLPAGVIVGLVLLACVLVYFAVFGSRLLPADMCEIDEDCMDKRLQEIYGSVVGDGYELEVPLSFRPKSLGELELRSLFNITVVGIAKNEGYVKNLAPVMDSVVGPGDVLWIISSKEKIEKVADAYGWRIKKQHEIFAEENSPDESGVIEGVVIPHSNLSGHTMAELRFRDLFQVNPLAIVRGDEIIMENINVTTLLQGDTILLQGRWQRFELLRQKMDIAFIEEVKGEQFLPERTRSAMFFVVLSLVLALSFHIKLSIALLTGALGMIITGVIAADRAYEAVDWRTVFLLSGLIPLGAAFEQTGAAAYLAERVMSVVGTPNSLVLLLVVSMLSAFFSLLASNVGAAVLMVPLAMNMAVEVGVNPVVAAIAVAMSASNTFILPTHQVNALLMRPGGYRTKDYMRAGIGITIIYTVVLVACLAMFYDL